MLKRFHAKLALAVMMVAAMTAAASAQIDTCNCHLVQIQASPELTCNVQVCTSNTPSAQCKSIAPGTNDVIPCPYGGGFIVIVDGCGLRHQIPVNGCVDIIPGPAPCCINACLWADEQGCLTLVLRKAPNVGHCFCPGG